MNIRTFSQECRELFGCKVYKLSLSSGCTCPNRDGTIGTGGCSFCSEGGSGEFAAPFLPIREQIALAKEKVIAKMPRSEEAEQYRYLAYFQSFTNTYGEPEKLRALYLETISQPEIVGISIGTRPDCLGPEILSLLEELNRIKPVWVELGLQTIHEETAQRIGRGYPLSVFEKAYRKLKEIGIRVVVHLILYLPGESVRQMEESVRYLATLHPTLDGIKFQLLQVLKNTRMAAEYEEKPFPLPTPEEYGRTLIRLIRLLPEQTVIHRITGDGPKRLLIEPKWCADKKRVLNLLNNMIQQEK